MVARLICLFALACPVMTLAAEPAGDWPSWRGPNRDGISKETGLLDQWPEGGPELLWRVDGKLGKGYSSIAIADGKIFTIGKRDHQAELIALDLRDGKELWSTPVGGGDPNCTPTVDEGLVYALSREGELVCCEAEDRQGSLEKKLPQRFWRKDDVRLGLQRIASRGWRPFDLHARIPRSHHRQTR